MTVQLELKNEGQKMSTIAEGGKGRKALMTSPLE